MGRRANPVVIGAFVVGAIALAVLGIVIFGSGRFFADTTPFVMYFTGSVDGLNVGSPVKFKGVEIGSVTSIQLDLGEEARIPVWIKIDNSRIVAHGLPSDPTLLKAAVDRGLRAQLNSQSIVTGLLFVQLDYHPDTPAVLVSPPEAGLNEIPTIPTTLEQAQQAAAEIIANLKQIDFEGFGRTLRSAIEALDRTLSSPGLQKAVEKLPETLANLNKTLGSVQQLASNLDQRSGPLLKSLNSASERTTVAVEQARSTLQSMQGLADAGSPLAGQLVAVLEELRGTARAIRLLADYLERNPSALVRGREVTQP
jgi:phospholipid/cholesterol/gamma-HCH transport system substrate-binding protein